MSNLHISEFSGIAATDQSDSIVAYSADALRTTQTVALGASSTQSNAFSASTTWVRLVAGAACSIAIGSNPTAAVGGWFIAAGAETLVRVSPGYKVAAITDTL